MENFVNHRHPCSRGEIFRKILRILRIVTSFPPFQMPAAPRVTRPGRAAGFSRPCDTLWLHGPTASLPSVTDAQVPDTQTKPSNLTQP